MIECIIRRNAFLTGKHLLILAALFDILSLAQSPSLPLAASASRAETPGASSPPGFEVSTVKLDKSGGSGSESSFQNGRFTASNVSLKNVIQAQAYGVPEPRILGGPKWLSSERFDIEAKCDTSVSDQLKTLDPDRRRALTQAMFQQFLADRFKLVVHWETRTLPVYSLVVAKNGPVLHESKELHGYSGTSMNTSGSSTLFTAEGVTMADLAQALTQELSSELGRVILDHTRLKGRYDITIKWTSDADAQPTNPGAEGTVPPPDSGVSIYTAIQEQLGLKLESTHGPVPVLVIDHVELPSEN